MSSEHNSYIEISRELAGGLLSTFFPNNPTPIIPDGIIYSIIFNVAISIIMGIGLPAIITTFRNMYKWSFFIGGGCITFILTFCVFVLISLIIWCVYFFITQFKYVRNVVYMQQLSSVPLNIGSEIIPYAVVVVLGVVSTALSFGLVSF